MITTFNEWKAGIDRKEYESFKNRVDEQQMTLGKLLEYNFIKMAEQTAVWNKKLDIKRVSKEMDLLFGADFKLTHHSIKDTALDNLSVHIDITSKKYKKETWILQENVFTMSNGLIVHYGVKFSNKYFYYNKPILVIILERPGEMFNPIFTQEDVITAIYKSAEICKFISYNINYKFADEWKYGGGKRASEIVNVKTNL